MTSGLVRYQQTGDLHFVTFSCYLRQPCLGTLATRDLFELSLETIRRRYDFFVTAYVVMPEHVHLTGAPHSQPATNIRVPHPSRGPLREGWEVPPQSAICSLLREVHSDSISTVPSLVSDILFEATPPIFLRASHQAA